MNDFKQLSLKLQNYIANALEPAEASDQVVRASLNQFREVQWTPKALRGLTDSHLPATITPAEALKLITGLVARYEQFFAHGNDIAACRFNVDFSLAEVAAFTYRVGIKGYESLDLSGHQLCHLSCTHLLALGYGLQNTAVKSLALSQSGLALIADNNHKWQLFCKGFAPFQYLNMSDNELGHVLSAEQWQYFIDMRKAAHWSRSSLDISYNALFSMAGDHLPWGAMIEKIGRLNESALIVKGDSLDNLPLGLWHRWGSLLAQSATAIEFSPFEAASIKLDSWSNLAYGLNPQYSKTLGYALHALAAINQLDAAAFKAITENPPGALHLVAQKMIKPYPVNQAMKEFYQLRAAGQINRMQFIKCALPVEVIDYITSFSHGVLPLEPVTRAVIISQTESPQSVTNDENPVESNSLTRLLRNSIENLFRSTLEAGSSYSLCKK